MGDDADGTICYEVVGSPCGVRTDADLSGEPIGDLEKGDHISGTPVLVNGATWIRLEEKVCKRFLPKKKSNHVVCWAIQEHPRRGLLLRATEQTVTSGPGADGEAKVGKPQETRVLLKVKNIYEEAVDLTWKLVGSEEGDSEKVSATMELVTEYAAVQTSSECKLYLPTEGAVVKRVSAGTQTAVTIRNMPAGQHYLVSALVTFADEREIRSPWIRMSTLAGESRSLELGNHDPSGAARGRCTACYCLGFVPVSRRSDSISAFFNCRRCSCHAECHEEANVSFKDDARMLKKIEEMEAAKRRSMQEEEDLQNKLRRIERRARERMQMPITFLPKEAADWEEYECYIWFWGAGMLHPWDGRLAGRRGQKQQSQEQRPQQQEQPALPATLAGKEPGLDKVSVVTPTIQSRQIFHQQLWRCFCQQTWPDKELIVIETYFDEPSQFLCELEKKDSRLIYLRFKVGSHSEVPIGAKRNIGNYVAQGRYVVNFDDDDLYSPTYIATMVNYMERSEADLITLSTWHVFDLRVGQFGLVDPVEWGNLKRKADGSVESWLWGYGFSYVYRLEPVLKGMIIYPEINMSEDYKFFKELRNFCGPSRAALMPDTDGVCMHMQHGANTSSSFCVREVSRDDILTLEVSEFLTNYMTLYPRRDTRSNNLILWRDCSKEEGE